MARASRSISAAAGCIRPTAIPGPRSREAPGPHHRQDAAALDQAVVADPVSARRAAGLPQGDGRPLSTGLKPCWRRAATSQPARHCRRAAAGTTWSTAVGTYISGAELGRMSGRDFVNYQDTEVNWSVVEGYGATIAAAGAELRTALGCPVSRIDHSGRTLKIETAKGTIAAEQAIVTLPTAVLADNERLFYAGAAATRREAARGLPLGLADKLFIALADAEDFEPNSRVFGAHRPRRHRELSVASIRPADDRGLFRRQSCRRAGGRGRARLLRFRGHGTYRPLRQRFRGAGCSRSRCIAGVPIRSRAAPIHMRCRAWRIAGRRWPRRSTAACSSPARPARAATSRPRMAAGSPAPPPPSKPSPCGKACGSDIPQTPFDLAQQSGSGFMRNERRYQSLGTSVE